MFHRYSFPAAEQSAVLFSGIGLDFMRSAVLFSHLSAEKRWTAAGCGEHRCAIS